MSAQVHLPTQIVCNNWNQESLWVIYWTGTQKETLQGFVKINSACFKVPYWEGNCLLSQITNCEIKQNGKMQGASLTS